MIKDMRGDTFTVGCKVARAVLFGKSPVINICEVTQITGDKLYLDNSKQPIKIPDRLLIVEQDPLVKIMTDFKKEETNE